MSEEKRLRKGRFVKESGESTLESDIEAAKVKTLNSFGPRIDKARERAERLKQRIVTTKEALKNGEKSES